MKTMMKMMRAKTLLALPVLSGLLFFSGCNSSHSGKPLDTATTGEVTIATDETMQPLIDTELQTFHALYKNAHVNNLYLPEEEAIQRFIKDTLRLVITSRQLNKQEMDYFNALKWPVRVTPIAYDAIAIIVNNKNMDSTLTLEQLGKILNGQVKNWNELDKSYANKPINVVFDNANSSTFSYLKDYFKLGNTLPSNFFAVKTNPEVISYVQKTPEALGVIGVSWISDSKDSASTQFRNSIKVMALSPPDSAVKADQPYYTPEQAWIALRYYPLVRTIYANSRELWAGLGTGFASFIAGEKGQRIAYWYGLVPAQMNLMIREARVDKEIKY